MHAKQTPSILSYCRCGRNRGAALLLMLLVSMAILMLLYFVDITAIFGPSPALQRGKRVTEDRPWLEEDRILPLDKIIQMPRPPKLQIEKETSIKPKVTRDGEDRGWLELVFSAGGEVAGSWHCEFERDKRVTTFDTSFQGNIDAEKTYEDKDGTDETMLYFIARGKYLEQVYNRRTTRGQLGGGMVYVTGWLGPNWRGHGKITLTTDKKSSVSFDWTY